MKILRAVAYTVALVAGIVLASANMTPVSFVYLPAFQLLSRPDSAQVEVPLALLLLAALVFGTLAAGASTLFEHVRLRVTVRRQRKINARLQTELHKLRSELEGARGAAESRGVELAAEQDKARRAEEAAAEAGEEARRQRERAEQAEQRAPVSSAPEGEAGSAA